MLGTAHHLSTRIVSSRHLMARVALVAMVALLVGSASAQADEAVAPEAVVAGPSETPAGESPTTSGGGPTSEAVVPPEGAGPAEPAKPAPEAASESSPPPPAGEAVSEPPPPPASEPPAEPTPPPASSEPAPERPTSESTGTETSSHSKADEKSSVVLPVLPGAVPPSAATPATAETTAAVSATGTPTGSMVIDLGEAGLDGDAATAHRAVTKKAAAAGSEGGSCELQGLGASSGGGCVGAWLRDAGPLTPQGVALSPAAVALGTVAIAGNGGASPDHGGTEDGGRSMPPAPGPAPGGASGSASGGGASGVGLAGFLAFVLLLALASPRAMRRLRLACLPWRTAFFVLIPERPG
jgi:outer membrane biosynthesis protein TonB